MINGTRYVYVNEETSWAHEFDPIQLYQAERTEVGFLRLLGRADQWAVDESRKGNWSQQVKETISESRKEGQERSGLAEKQGGLSTCPVVASSFDLFLVSSTPGSTADPTEDWVVWVLRLQTSFLPA